MAKVFTSDELLTLARDIGKIPNTEAPGSADADLLGFMNLFLKDTMAPAIMDVREGYFDRQVRTTLVASTSRYRINPRAILGTLRDIRYINSSGYRSPPLEQISAGEVDQAKDSDSATVPTGFYLEGDYIVLLPTLGSSVSGSLEQVVPLRPSELVLETNVRVVSAVNTGTKTITTSASVPAGWSTNDTFDVHSKYSGAELKCWDKVASTVSGTTITFTTDIAGTLTGEYAIEVGDYVCLAEEAAVPAIPKDMHEILALATAVEFTASVDLEHSQFLEKKLTQKMQIALGAMKPRIPGKRKVLRMAPFIALQGLHANG